MAKKAKKPRKRQYGSGSITRLGARWRIRWRVAGQQHSEMHASRDLADRALRGIQGDLARGRARVPLDPDRIPTMTILAKRWFDDREGPANRNNDDERRKWANHLEPELGRLRPDEVTTLRLRSIIAAKLAGGRLRKRKGSSGKGLSPTTVLQLMRILSSLYTHLIEEGTATGNPVHALPKATRRKIRPAYDWRNTPYLQRRGDYQRVFAALPRGIDVAFAIGVMRGLRPGEIRALRWEAVDLDQRLLHVRIQVRNGKVGPPKSGRSRTVSISPSLYAVLAKWRLESGGKGLVIPPGKRRWPFKGGKFIGEKALNRQLTKALAGLGLPPMIWYCATRHTFGSHFILDGGSREKLAEILGHSSSEVTKRYSHLRPEMLGDEDTSRAQVDLSREPGEVLPLKTPAW